MLKKFIYLFLFLCLLILSCKAETSDYAINITYSDGSSGILCIDSDSLLKSEIRTYIKKVTFTSGEETPIDITSDIEIEEINGNWVVSYTTKEGWWIFSSKKTFYETIIFNELYALSIIYPDGNGKYLRINNETVQKSDLSRLKIQATFNNGSKKDVTDSCKLALTTTKDRIQVTYELRRHTIPKQYNISTDKLSELKVEKTGFIPDYPPSSIATIKANVKVSAVYSSNYEVELDGQTNQYSVSSFAKDGIITFRYGCKDTTIEFDKLTSMEAVKVGFIPDYPVPSEEDVKANTVVYAVYSDGARIVVTDEANVYSFAQDGFILVQYGDKETNIKYDRFTGLEIQKTGLISDYPVLSEENIRANVKAYAQYSDGTRIDVTDEINEYSIDDSGNIKVQYGNKEATIEYDRLTGLEVLKTGLISDYPSLTEYDILHRIKLCAVYSNGEQVDISDEKDSYSLVMSPEGSNIQFKYGNKSATLEYDILSGLEVEKTGLVSDYPVLSDKELAGNIKVYALYSGDQKVDITSKIGSYLTNISRTDNGIQIDFGNASATIEYDRLIRLEAEKTGRLTDYPASSEEDIKSRVKLYAVYSNNQKVDITEEITVDTSSSSKDQAAASLTDDTMNFSYGEKNTSVDLDKLISITAESTDGSKILISNFSNLDTEKLRSKLKITATYSNGEQIDITNRASIKAEGSSGVSLKFGTHTIDTEDIVIKAYTLVSVLTRFLSVLSVISLAASGLILRRMKKNKADFTSRRQKLFPDQSEDTV